MLARWDPFREIDNVSETFDRFVNRFWNGQQWVGNTVPLDVAETDEGYVVRASVPGLNPDDLEITLNNNVLTIRGEVKPDQDVDRTSYYLQERWFGQFQRSLTLPVKIEVEDIQANYEAGVLTLFLPKSEEARPKRIQVHSGAQQKMLDGRLTERN